MVFKDSKKALRKNPKLKRRNKKGNFNLKKSHGIYISSLALRVERERKSIISALLRKERGLFSREEEEEGVGSAFFSPKVVVGVFTNNKKRERERCLASE